MRGRNLQRSRSWCLRREPPRCYHMVLVSASSYPFYGENLLAVVVDELERLREKRAIPILDRDREDSEGGPAIPRRAFEKGQRRGQGPRTWGQSTDPNRVPVSAVTVRSVASEGGLRYLSGSTTSGYPFHSGASFIDVTRRRRRCVRTTECSM